MAVWVVLLVVWVVWWCGWFGGEKYDLLFCCDRFGVGQNLYIYKQSLRRAETDWEKAVEDWYDEVTLFSSAKVPG